MWEDLGSISSTKKRKVSIKISEISPSLAGFRIDRLVTGQGAEQEKPGLPERGTPWPAKPQQQTCSVSSAGDTGDSRFLACGL